MPYASLGRPIEPTFPRGPEARRGIHRDFLLEPLMSSICRAVVSIWNIERVGSAPGNAIRGDQLYRGINERSDSLALMID